MALWKITAILNRNNGKQNLEKGMFIEVSTPTTTPPLGFSKNDQQIKGQFKSKYGIDLDALGVKINASYFSCTKA